MWQYSTTVKHQEKGDNRFIRLDNFTASSILTRFSAFRLSSLKSRERRFKRQTLCQWRGSENCSDEVAQRTFNRILQGRDTCFYSKVLLRETVTMLRSTEVMYREPVSFWYTIHVLVPVIIPVQKKKGLLFTHPCIFQVGNCNRKSAYHCWLWTWAKTFSSRWPLRIRFR